jgi:DNA-binding NarL/FixJ family response regulator
MRQRSTKIATEARRVEVLRLLREGRYPKAIAYQLRVRIYTVYEDMQALRAKRKGSIP